jgi:hypothetical protein
MGASNVDMKMVLGKVVTGKLPEDTDYRYESRTGPLSCFGGTNS